MMSVSAAVVVSGCELVGSDSMTFLVSDWDSSSLQPPLFPNLLKQHIFLGGERRDDDDED